MSQSIVKNTLIKKNGVYITEDPSLAFSSLYLKVRNIENRVYSDELVSKLPFVSIEHLQCGEWKKRQITAKRFIEYLSNKSTNNLLDIGCGNGWFTNMCSEKVNKAVGVDINIQELEQAGKVFNSSNLSFIYWDLFTSNPFSEKFQVIVLNASIQYFKDFNLVISNLEKLLTPSGEIHILDSPFYKESEVKDARIRTENYYREQGVGEMSKYYHHHTFNMLNDFMVIYKPANRIIRLLKRGDSPFMWLRKQYNK
jgi:ubiquinone/menaquinone biosynthesis C-methylase UbiE